MGMGIFDGSYGDFRVKSCGLLFMKMMTRLLTFGQKKLEFRLIRLKDKVKKRTSGSLDSVLAVRILKFITTEEKNTVVVALTVALGATATDLLKFGILFLRSLISKRMAHT